MRALQQTAAKWAAMQSFMHPLELFVFATGNYFHWTLGLKRLTLASFPTKKKKTIAR